MHAFSCWCACNVELILHALYPIPHFQAEPVLLSKYHQSHLESYLEDNQKVAFCPSKPWCGNAIEVRQGGPWEQLWEGWGLRE